MKKWLTIIFTITFVLVADLTTKHFLFSVSYFNLIPKVISVSSNGGNTGAAFGVFSNKTMLLIIVSSVLIIGLFIFNFFARNNSIFYCIGFGLTVGGAVGNLVDRVMLGYVRDWIYLDIFPNFPTFNLADSCLCVGVIMLAIQILFVMPKRAE